jgi:hypothetical protein
MPRFASLKYAPAETRIVLRERLLRHLGREPQGRAAAHVGTVLTDEDMVRLLESLDLTFGSEWVRVLATYEAALPGDGSEPPLQERLDAGRGRLVWGRIKISLNIGLAFHRKVTHAGAFENVLRERFIENYRITSGVQLEGELLELAQRLEAGEIEFRQLTCRSPRWVAARLWDQSLAAQDDVKTLRTWVDRWNVLGSPTFAASKVWDGEAGQRFRQAVFNVIEIEEALQDWEATHDRFAKETAVTSGQEVGRTKSNLPVPPKTLVNRALWLEDNRVTGHAYDSVRACSDILFLVSLLLTDIDQQSFSAAPHPLAARVFDLAGGRPDLLFHLVNWARSHPRLLADLLLYPMTCPLACLIIAQWRPNPIANAFDRQLVQQADELAKAAAFEDAMSLLVWWLEKGLAAPAEAAALFAWLHQVAGAGFIDDLGPQERLRMIMRNALMSLDASILEGIVSCLAEEPDNTGRLGNGFAAALEIVALGDLSSQLNPTPLVENYIDALTTSTFGLSAQRIGVKGAAALFELAQHARSHLHRFLHPIDVGQRLTQIDNVDANPYMTARELAESVRAHIRVLSRAITGSRLPVSDDLAAALASSVWSGALDHREMGRIAAFAPRYETDAIGTQLDRPIAIDLAAALTALSGEQREKLLSEILETNEPMILAQLLPCAPRAARPAIEARLSALPPAKAGETLSLIEVQARIDQLLSAGALGAAEKFIEEEKQIRTFGPVQGREVMRLRWRLRVLFARGAWEEIMAVQQPSDLALHEKENVADAIQFYRGLTLLVRPKDPNPEAAEGIFRALHQRRPAVTTYAVNAIAAKIGTLLKGDVFGRLDDKAARSARQVLLEIDALENSVSALTPIDRETNGLNQAILKLALNEPDDALAILPASVSAQREEGVQAYRAVALSRLGRLPEAISVLQTAEESFGKTELLRAAWAQISQGTPFAGRVGISSNDDPVISVRVAYRNLLVLDPIQQASVVSLGADPFTTFVIDQVRGAAASVVALVPMMGVTEIDGCEDDVTAIIRELLLSRLDFLRWSSPDQSKGGHTPKGNPGERDLLIM